MFVLFQTMRRSSDQAGILLSGVQLPQYTPPQEMYPGCHPSLNPALIMRPAMPHTDKDQVPYPAGLHSLSPGVCTYVQIIKMTYLHKNKHELSVPIWLSAW